MSAFHPSSCSAQTLDTFLTRLSLTPHTHAISESRRYHCSPSLLPYPGLCHCHLLASLLRWPPNWPPCSAHSLQSVLLVAARVRLPNCKSARAQNPPMDPGSLRMKAKVLPGPSETRPACLAAPSYFSLPHPLCFSHTGPNVILKNASCGLATVPLHLLLPLLGKLSPRQSSDCPCVSGL